MKIVSRSNVVFVEKIQQGGEEGRGREEKGFVVSKELCFRDGYCERQ